MRGVCGYEIKRCSGAEKHRGRADLNDPLALMPFKIQFSLRITDQYWRHTTKIGKALIIKTVSGKFGL